MIGRYRKAQHHFWYHFLGNHRLSSAFLDEKNSESLRFLGTCSLTKPMYEVRISCFFVYIWRTRRGFHSDVWRRLKRWVFFHQPKAFRWNFTSFFQVTSTQMEVILSSLKGSLKTPKQVTGNLDILFLRSIFFCLESLRRFQRMAAVNLGLGGEMICISWGI